jgi:phage terminase large subunit
MATTIQKKKKPKINFNPKIFNKIYWHLREAFSNPLIRFIWCFGGSSAAKTYSTVQLIIVRMLSHKNENTMVLRKYAVDIKDSIYSDFTTIISDWKLNDEFVIQQNYIRCKKTGSYVRFRGLDDSEKIKGLSGFKRVVLEEISQFEEKDLKQIRKRLRGKPGQQIVGIFNPIDETHWIKTKIFDKEDLKPVDTDIAGIWVNEMGNVVVLKTNYLDNKYIVGDWSVDPDGNLVQIGGFVDQHTIDDFEKDKLEDYEYYRIYGLGDWGRIRVGGEFWKKFKTADHVNDIGWDKYLPISLTWDENVNPYLTCAVWQIRGKHAQQIDEIFLEDPLNRVKDVCAEFSKRYPKDQVKGLFIYGDRTSLKEDTKKEKGENFFTDITKYLKDYHPTVRLQSKNPSVAQSGKFINEIYEGTGGSGITIGINNKCKLSIFDYTYALEDSDGTMLKSKKKNPVTKVTYEEFGHASDAKRYLITTAFAAQYEAFQNKKKSNLSALSGIR